MKENTTELTLENYDEILEYAKTSNTGFILSVSLGVLLKLWKSDLIVPYPQNRSGNLSTSRVRQIAERYSPNSLGQVTVAYFNGALQLVDFHHRMHSTEYLNDVLLGFSPFSSEKISIKIVPANMRIRTYQELNAGKSHTGAEKINNPDLAVGSYAAEIKEKADYVDLLKGKTQNLMDCVLAYEQNGRAMSLSDIFTTRTKISKLLNQARDRRSFSMQESSVDKGVQALRKYKSVINFISENDEVRSEVKDFINKSSGFFFTFIMDHMSDGGVITGFSKLPNKDLIKLLSGKKFSMIKANVAALVRRDMNFVDIGSVKKALSF